MHQVIRRRGESETPADTRHTAELDFAEQSYGLQPAADLFDPFACLFTDRQSPGVAWSDRQWYSSAASGTGRHAGHLSLPQCVHERDDGIVLIAAVGYRPTLCNAFRISCRISLTPRIAEIDLDFQTLGGALSSWPTKHMLPVSAYISETIGAQHRFTGLTSLWVKSNGADRKRLM